MHRLARGLLLCSIACKGEPQRVPTPVVAVADAVAIDAAPPPRTITEFRSLSASEREARRVELVAALPAAWKPVVSRIDFAGYPTFVELTVPDAIDDAHRIEELVAIVRERAALFGILDGSSVFAASELPLSRANGPVVAPTRWQVPFDPAATKVMIAAGTKWTGSIYVTLDRRRVSLSGHLWPIETVTPSGDHEALVKPFYGRKGSFRSKCLKECGKRDYDFTLGPQSFRVIAGTALVCTASGIVPRSAIAIELEEKGRLDEAKPELPHLVDGKTGEPIAGSYAMPGDGERTREGALFGSEHPAPPGCFD